MTWTISVFGTYLAQWPVNLSWPIYLLKGIALSLKLDLHLGVYNFHWLRKRTVNFFYWLQFFILTYLFWDYKLRLFRRRETCRNNRDGQFGLLPTQSAARSMGASPSGRSVQGNLCNWTTKSQTGGCSVIPIRCGKSESQAESWYGGYVTVGQWRRKWW